MSNKDYTKCFFNDKTGLPYKTLKAAKESSDSPRVYRCWMISEEIVAMRQVFAYGTSVCTIREADKKIAEAVQKGDIGKGKTNKLIV